MMRFLFIILCFFATSFAEIVVDQVKRGAKVLNVTLLDSIGRPDINKIEVKGHQVENVVFVENNDANVPTLLKENVINFSALFESKVLSYHKPLGLMEVELPTEISINDRSIILAKNLGGVMVRVIHAEEASRLGGLSVWKLKVAPAKLSEVVLQCDLSFSVQPTLSFAMADSQWQEFGADLGGEDSPPSMSLKMEKTKLSGQPVLTGHLKIIEGKVDVYDLSLDGVFEMESFVTLTTTGNVKRQLTKKLPFVFSHHIPLDKGVFIHVRHGFSASFEVQIDEGENQLELNFSEEVSLRMGLSEDGQWIEENAEVNVLFNSSVTKSPVAGKLSQGRVKASLVPRLGVDLLGSKPLKLNLPAYVKLSQSRNFMGGVNRILSVGGRLGGSFKKGNQTSDFERVIAFPPNKLIAVEKREVHADSIVLDWFHYPENLGYVIQKFTAEGWRNIDTVPFGPVTLRGFEPSTEYTLRIVPQNNLGVGLPEIVTFKTLIQSVLPPPPSLVYPQMNQVVKGDSLRFSWSSVDTGTFSHFSYSLYIGKENPPLNKLAESDKPFKIITTLKPNQQYYWRVVVSDGKEKVESFVWGFKTEALLKEKKQRKNSVPQHIVGRVSKIPSGVFENKNGKRTKVKTYYMHQFEVTQKEFQRIAKKNPSYRKGKNLPVENVTWKEADDYCREVNGRLPTEVEWEYAIRAEEKEDYYWKKKRADKFAWYFKNSNNQTHPVGQKKPNKWGLYDMSGNVFEWVDDWYQKETGHSKKESKVTRGGSWFSDVSSLKSSAQFKNRPNFSSLKLGFRCAFDESD